MTDIGHEKENKVYGVSLFEFTVYLWFSSWLHCTRFHGLALFQFVI